jgi:hypothetical protein
MKMRSRAEHWISMGMITNICNITENSVCAAAEIMVDTSVKIDRDLMEFLKGGLKFGSYLREIMEYHNDHMKSQYDRKDQFDDLKYDKDLLYEAIVVATTHKDEESGEDYQYTPEIAVMFHHLLVSSLLSYVFRLRIVEEAVKTLPNTSSPSPNPPFAVVAAFTQLLLSAQLLFVVSHSNLFRMHLKSLGSRLTIPTDAQAMLYRREFMSFALWHAACHKHDKTLVDQLKATRSQSLPESVQASAVKDSAVEASAIKASATEEPDAEAADDSEILDRDPESDPESYMLHRRWIMGMVDHFAAIRVLERVCRKLPPEAKINFSILGLNRPSIESDSWGTMVKEIQTICQDSSLVSKALERPLPDDLANKAINIIVNKIKEYEFRNYSMKKTSTQFEAAVYAFFKALISKQPNKIVFSGCGHCEAILMAAIHRICNENDLDFSLKACSPLTHFYLTD